MSTVSLNKFVFRFQASMKSMSSTTTFHHQMEDSHNGHHKMSQNDLTTHSGHSSGHSPYFSNFRNFHVLFDNWIVRDDKDLAWSCVVLSVACIFYEILKILKQKTIRQRNKNILESRL